jgi:hypothetical protein
MKKNILNNLKKLTIISVILIILILACILLIHSIINNLTFCITFISGLLLLKLGLYLLTNTNIN